MGGIYIMKEILVPLFFEVVTRPTEYIDLSVLPLKTTDELFHEYQVFMDYKRYIPLSVTETIVPAIFFAIYIYLFIQAL